MERFINIDSIDALLKEAALRQVSIPFGEQGVAGTAAPSDMLAKPVPSIKLPGASKKRKRKYPKDIIDEYKVITQPEDKIQPWWMP